MRHYLQVLEVRKIVVDHSDTAPSRYKYGTMHHWPRSPTT